jgi:hypothetical protein
MYNPPSLDHPQLKRTKTEVRQTMPALAGAINQILEDISQPQEVVDAQVQNIMEQINKSLILITNAAQKARERKIAAAESEANKEMERIEQQQIDDQISNFKAEFNKIIDSDEVRGLNNTQRRQLFSGLTKLTTGFFTTIQVERELEQDASIINRFREVWMIMIEMLGTYVSTIKDRGPDFAKKSAAIMSALFMFIGFLAPEQRNLISSTSPTLAALINATYVSRPYIKDWLQAGAGVTMIYYFLKNAGIETSEYIESIGRFASEKTSNTVNSLSDMFTNNLTNWLTSEYSGFEIEGTQETNFTRISSNSTKATFLTGISRSTQKQLDELHSISTNPTMYSVKSIQILLANNEDSDDKSNIVDPNQNLQDNSIEVQQRLEAIHNAEQEEEQGKQSETSSVISEMPTQLDESQQSNNISALSTTSNDSELEIWFWDIDKNRKGGKKRRNNKNKNKNKNTNKYRKYRKNVTKKRKPKYSKKRKLLRLKIRRTMKKH